MLLFVRNQNDKDRVDNQNGNIFSIAFSIHYFRGIKQGDPAKGKGDNQQRATELLIMADDEGLEAIRQKRLAELQGQHGDFAVQSLFLFNYNQAKILSVQFGYC